MRNTRRHRRFKYLVIGAAALGVVTSCGGGPSNGFLELELSQPDMETSAELPIAMCSRGAIQAFGDSWKVSLDEERGGAWVRVIITTPEGDRMVGSMVDSQGLTPWFSGSGSTVLRPEDDPNGEASTAELAWLCD